MEIHRHGYITESLQSFANAQNVMLRVESSEAQLVMDYDPERLLQIAYNLLSNAIKFTPSGGKVTLRTDLTTFDNQPNLKLTVTDVRIERREVRKKRHLKQKMEAV